MAKINWNRHRYVSKMETNYWNDHKNGWDKEFWQKRDPNKKIKLGIHENHDWHPVKLDSGIHAGKIICKTCDNKFVTWLSKGAI